MKGHCLVISKRVVPRFTDLSADEVSDLWNTARILAGPLETFFNAEAFTFAIQDGVAAGQSVPHVHIHLLPRKCGDFPRNDQIYHELDQSDAGRHVVVDAPDERKPRTKLEMAAEAAALRPLFTTSLPIPNDELLSALN